MNSEEGDGALQIEIYSSVNLCCRVGQHILDLVRTMVSNLVGPWRVTLYTTQVPDPGDTSYLGRAGTNPDMPISTDVAVVKITSSPAPRTVDTGHAVCTAAGVVRSCLSIPPISLNT